MRFISTSKSLLYFHPRISLAFIHAAPSTHRSFVMSSRRSARLSARDLTDLTDLKSEKDTKSPATKISGQGRKVKTSTPTARKRAPAKAKASTPNATAPSKNAIAPVTKPKEPRKRKAPKEEPNQDSTTTGEPATPLKRSKTQSKIPYPSTPDFSFALAKPRPKKNAATETASSTPRPANPKATNAPLQTPGGSRVLKAYPTDLFESPHTARKTNLTTTDNLRDTAIAHLLSVDPRLKTVIDKHPCTVLTPESLQEKVDPFNALCSSIISQQVSGAAASSIKRKFIALFLPDGADVPAGFFPSPAQVKAESLERLRTAGLSGRKAEYISGLASNFADGQLSAQMLIDASDEELLEKLIAVRGLGRWSVEMFAFFALKRLDIFSTGDLGVQRGMAAYMGRDVSKLKAKGGGKWKYMKEDEMMSIANRFVPYRSVFMWYMWRIEDVKLDALGG